MTTKPTPLELFYSYSHADEDLRNELAKQLSILRRQGIIAPWHDRKIGAGTEWKGQIDAHLNSARIILLLVSSDFLASDYCYDIEMQRALARHEAGEARVIPVILRPCLWKHPPIDKLQALPRDAKAITTWPNIDEAFLNVAEGIREVVQELARTSPTVWQQLIERQRSAAGSYSPARLEVSDTPQVQAPPHIFTGRVTFSGLRLVTGPTVTAWVDDSQVPGATARVYPEGLYTLLVAQPPRLSFSGKTICFRVGSRPAKQTAVWQAGARLS